MDYASKETLDALKDFDSATVFNAVVESMGGSQGGTELEVKGGIPENYTGPDIRSMLPELGPAVGYAVTAEVTTNDPDSEFGDWDAWYAAINEVPAPVISVIKDVDSRPGRGACVGDGMAAACKSFGVVGFVVDGSVRDLMGIKRVGVPVWASGLVPGHGVFGMVRFNTSTTLGSLRVQPGELIVADTDGCTSIPRDMDPAVVLEYARRIREREAETMARHLDPSSTPEKWEAGR
jgi:regulator of RNase E activity RraA